MANFSGSDLTKDNFKYLKQVLDKVKSGDELAVVKNKETTEYNIDYSNFLMDVHETLDITSSLDVFNLFNQNNSFLPVFTTRGNAFRWTELDKSPFSGLGGLNTLGKALSDAGEKATIMSLSMEINTPEDTSERVFMDNPDAFYRWLPTFKYTSEIINQIDGLQGGLGDFEIIHDANSDSSEIANAIKMFVNRVGVKNDSWNPADIYLVKQEIDIAESLREVLDNYNISNGLVSKFNGKIFDYYEQKLMFPISLKQLDESTNEHSTLNLPELNNVPGKTVVDNYDVFIDKFTCNLSRDGREIGGLTFKKCSGKIILMQVRGFPHNYGTSQVEITSDGSLTGGRLGKVPTKVVDRILSDYSCTRIKSIKYFGSRPDYFSEFCTERIAEVYEWYLRVTEHTRVVNVNKLNLEQFTELVTEAQQCEDLAANLAQKIQGLKIMLFFIENESNLTDIMTQMINGAKKISSEAGFFIKVY